MKRRLEVAQVDRDASGLDESEHDQRSTDDDTSPPVGFAEVELVSEGRRR